MLWAGWPACWGLFDGVGAASQYAVIFGLSLGATHNVRRGRAWRPAPGLKEALVGSLVFFAAGAVLESSPIFLPLAQQGRLSFALSASAVPALRGGLPAGALFAAPFLTGYTGLLFYPFEVALFSIQAVRAQREPGRAMVHLRRSPLTHEARRLPLRWRMRRARSLARSPA